MPERAFIYDAYISYRRQSPDTELAELLKRRLLRGHQFDSGEVAEKRAATLYWEREEYPLSDDIGDEAREAIRSSRWFIAVASVNYQLSKWCMEELRYFIECNDNKTDHVLILLCDGESTFIPGAPVPDEHIADIRADSSGGRMRLFKTRYTLIAAPVLGCGSEQLDTARRRVTRNTTIVAITLSIILLAVLLIAGTAQLSRYSQSQKSSDICRRVEQLISAVDDGRRVDALRLLGSLQNDYEPDEYEQYITGEAKLAAISANYIPAFGRIAAIDSNAAVVQASASGEYVLTCSRPHNGFVTLTVYDRMLNEQLCVNTAPENSIYGPSGTLDVTLDYDANKGLIYFASSGALYAVEPNGRLTRILKLLEKPEEPLLPDGLSGAYGPYVEWDGGAYALVGRDFSPEYVSGSDIPTGSKDFNSTAPSRLVRLSKSGDIMSCSALMDIYQPDYGYSYSALVVTPDGENIVVVTTNGSYSFCLDFYSLSLGRKLSSVYMDGRYSKLDFSQYNQTGWIFCRAEYDGMDCLAAFDVPDARWENGELVRDANSFRYAQFAEGLSGWSVKNNMIYALGGGKLYSLTRDNLSLIDMINGSESAQLSTAPEDNLLLDGKSEPPEDGILRATLSFHDDYVIVSDSVQHKVGFTDANGENAALWLALADDEAQTSLLRFVSPASGVTQYYSHSDGVFGFIDYSTGETVQSFNVYSCDDLAQLAAKALPASEN